MLILKLVLAAKWGKCCSCNVEHENELHVSPKVYWGFKFMSTKQESFSSKVLSKICQKQAF